MPVVDIVTIRVPAEHRDLVLDEARTNVESSRDEPGVVRFDLLLADDPGEFLLYEAYTDEAAREAHRETDHFARWADRARPKCSHIAAERYRLDSP